LILLRGGIPILFSPGELLNIWHQAHALQNHGGAFAEVGAFRGDSAEIICDAKGERDFYVFESFQGLPEVSIIDTRYSKGLFRSEEQRLRDRLRNYSNTIVIAGYFPDTASSILPEKFSFVHVDLDLYQPTLKALMFFYPKMLPGGRIVVHDYSHCVGVFKAVDEFFGNKPENVEPMAATQALIIKK